MAEIVVPSPFAQFSWWIDVVDMVPGAPSVKRGASHRHIRRIGRAVRQEVVTIGSLTSVCTRSLGRGWATCISRRGFE